MFCIKFSFFISIFLEILIFNKTLFFINCLDTTIFLIKHLEIAKFPPHLVFSFNYISLKLFYKVHIKKPTH